MKEAIALKKELAKLLNKQLDTELISKLENYCNINLILNYIFILRKTEKARKSIIRISSKKSNN